MLVIPVLNSAMKTGRYNNLDSITVRSLQLAMLLTYTNNSIRKYNLLSVTKGVYHIVDA